MSSELSRRKRLNCKKRKRLNRKKQCKCMQQKDDKMNFESYHIYAGELTRYTDRSQPCKSFRVMTYCVTCKKETIHLSLFLQEHCYHNFCVYETSYCLTCFNKEPLYHVEILSDIPLLYDD